MGKHDKTLAAVFADPPRGNIQWHDIESLLVHLGAEISEGSGSRIHVVLRGVKAIFHRPHPRPGASKGIVRAVRDYLTMTGHRP